MDESGSRCNCISPTTVTSYPRSIGVILTRDDWQTARLVAAAPQVIIGNGTTLLAGVTTSIAQILQYKEPEEALVKQYERLRADGVLLSPEGWKQASKLFERPKPYPADSEILLISSPGIIGRISADGDRAHVGTKWGDSCGTIDSQLRYQPNPIAGCIMTEEEFSLVFEHHPLHKPNGAQSSDSGEWKIEEAPQRRAADIPAIKYVERMRDQSKDLVIRSNANKTIATLKRLTRGCGNASAC